MELHRRRREALALSVMNPHPESASLADVGLGEWLSNLEDGDDLVETTGGTAVRGVDGQGWMRDAD